MTTSRDGGRYLLPPSVRQKTPCERGRLGADPAEVVGVEVWAAEPEVEVGLAVPPQAGSWAPNPSARDTLIPPRKFDPFSKKACEKAHEIYINKRALHFLP